ncbi:hypothetical protein [Raoultibacter phocaeensis]|uniref:hypothetical protein n=1 Tax=Raoultibacter phocaeensis TaxID=2479841 RepID=UPI00111A915D|nr:hypothetical protein [Raoultibacter phocaeensis]
MRSKLVTSHVWQGTVPARSFVRASGDVYVATPELCVIQEAGSLEFAQTVCLAYELCGTYSLRESSMAGFVTRPPLTDPEKLNAFLDVVAGLRGIGTVRRVLRLVLRGSASPMETVVVILLCFPCSLGGYGLPWPILNHRIDVGKASRMVEKGFYRCDLCWPDEKIAIEYDSDLFHTGSSRIARDSKRRNDLISLGYEVMTVTKGQVFDYGAFDRFARQFAKRAGFRIRERVADCDVRRRDLRANLFAAMRYPA